MNKPVKSKLTCKGKVPEQLSSVGVDHKGLFNHTIAGLDVDVSDLMETAAQRVIDAVNATTNKNGVPYGELLDKVNGVGYMEQWAVTAAEMAMVALLGTAAQGWAYKHVVANAEGFDVDLFNSAVTGAVKVDVESDFD